ncbi:MAG: cytochrome c biogenesis protein ResB, partial [Phycisphaerales bacterium]
MNKFRREIMWAALALIIMLTVLSIYGAFIGADRAQMFFNSMPAVVFWALFALALIAGLAAFRRLIRVPGLLLMHAGCILILIGGALGSEKGYRATGNDKILKGDMQLFEGQATKQVRTERKIPLFSIALDFAERLNASSIPQNLRQEFEKEQRVLSQAAKVFVSQPGTIWIIAEEDGQYYIRREGKKLKVYDFVREVKELPFVVRLNDFKIEYYEPKFEYLDYETPDGMERVPAEIGRVVDLGPEHGTAKITRKFRNLKISMNGDEREYYDDQGPEPNPALELQITRPDGQVTTRFVYTLHPDFSHTPGGPKLRYTRPAFTPFKDWISALEITDTDGKVLAKKD